MEDRLTWLGHATVQLELAGARLLTDPLLRLRVAHLRRQVPVPPSTGPTDAVLISHLHRDHLDLPSLKRVDASARVIVPRGGAAPVRRTGREVVELSAGEAVDVGDARVLAVPADHDGRRSPVSAPTESVGYVVEGSGLRVYFAGDTDVFGGMAELGPLDVALLPVWGWGPSLGPGHMDPEAAARAAELLRPRLAVPIHWGTYLQVGLRDRARLLHEPPRRFATRCAELGIDVRLLEPGGSLALAPAQ